MNIETRQAYSEVTTILEIMDEIEAGKIPPKLRSYFKREKDNGYIPSIDLNIPIAEQKFKRKTLAIIAALNIHYWCENDSEKQELVTKYAENSRKNEEMRNKKYNANNIFKNAEGKGAIKSEEVALVKYRENSVFRKMLLRIKGIFSKRI